METPPPIPAPYAGSLASIKDKAAWREQYFATVEALETLRTKDLASMTEEEALRRMHSLVACETPWRERRDWSGLVEQQAIFLRGRKK